VARNDWYSIRDEGQFYVVEKFDPDDRTLQTDKGPQNLPNRYTIGKEKENLAMCDCFAGHKFCRHKQMLREFIKHDRVGQRWLYNFDKNKWLPPYEVKDD
jgi:hypothetical protein